MNSKMKNYIIRPLINFLIERFYPQGIFWGKSFVVDQLRHHKGESETDGVMGTGAALILSMIAHENQSNHMTINMNGRTSDGVDIGDWRVIVERTDI